MKTRLIQLGLLSAAVAALGTAYAAQTEPENDAVNPASVSVSMSQAIETAEKAGSGQATRAELEHSKQGLVYDIEVVNGAKVHDVRVDAQRGSVVFVKVDSIDKEPVPDAAD